MWEINIARRLSWLQSLLRPAKLPTHVQLAASQGGLSKDSVVLLEQLRTIDKQRLKERIGALNETQLPDVEKALSVSLGIANSMENR